MAPSPPAITVDGTEYSPAWLTVAITEEQQYRDGEVEAFENVELDVAFDEPVLGYGSDDTGHDVPVEAETPMGSSIDLTFTLDSITEDLDQYRYRFTHSVSSGPIEISEGERDHQATAD